MNRDQIAWNLQKMFEQPLNNGAHRHIVFWVDQEKEFVEEVKEIQIEHVKLHILTENNQFYTKYLLEEEDPHTSYLIYTHVDMNSEQSWLRDTALYSNLFYADRISMIADELQLDATLRAVIQKNKRFFNSRERYRKFKTHQVGTYTKEKMELMMMSVLCNVKTPHFDAILKAILMDTLDRSQNKWYANLERFFDINIFWNYVATQYDFDPEEEKSLKALVVHLTVTAFSHSIDVSYLKRLDPFIANRNQANALVFIDHWMHHKKDFAVYDEYVKEVEKEIQLADMIKEMSMEDIVQADVFPSIDSKIIRYIANGLERGLEDYDVYTKLIKRRRVKHYYEKYANIYEALYYTVKMFSFYKQHQSIPQGQATALYTAYVKEYYKMDFYYRKFYVAYDQTNHLDLLKTLRKQVENLYVNWYMGELSTHWSQAVDREMKLEWSLPRVRNQQDFYGGVIGPHIRSGDRVFMIISDAMRYEVGYELSERLNTETRSECDLQSLLGVVPSITKLGMASLLPHREIDFDKKGNVHVDGQDSAGIANRKHIIESEIEDSMAIYYKDVMAMNATKRRERFKGKKLIYIYHDSIDAIGDKASTEIHTFRAAERTVSELYELVRIIRDQLSGINIYITADHGFLYQRDELAESDKIGKEELRAIESKRRYILSREKRDIPGSLNINLSSVIANKEQLTVYVPNATIRYRMQGAGVNFIHGGASLQEVVVPLLSIKNKRTGQRGAPSVKKVDIKLTSTTRKITNSMFYLDFFQTEKVAEKVIPRRVAIYFADEEGTVLSNEEILIGDRPFDNPVDRTFKLQFVLPVKLYDKAKNYYLVVKDTEAAGEIEKTAFSIDIGMHHDFEF